MLYFLTCCYRRLLFVALTLLSTFSLALELDGQFVQGGVLVGTIKGGEKVLYRGNLLPLDPEGRFIVALDRDAAPELVLQIKREGQTVDYLYAVEPREYHIQHINGVQQKYVAPDQAQIERARREAAKVIEARRLQRMQNDFFEGFVWPLKGPITGVFGSQRVYNGVPKRPHYGVDIARAVGTPVVAPAAGVVTMAESDLFYSGGTMIIDHGHGLTSTFLHLSALDVAKGEAVQQGQKVAEVGNTGRTTGPHLDWRMNWGIKGHRVRLDPQLLVPPMPEEWSDH